MTNSDMLVSLSSAVMVVFEKFVPLDLYCYVMLQHKSRKN